MQLQGLGAHLDQTIEGHFAEESSCHGIYRETLKPKPSNILWIAWMFLPRGVRRLGSCAARINLEKTCVQAASYKNSFPASDVVQYADQSTFMSFLEITLTTVSMGLILLIYYQCQWCIWRKTGVGKKLMCFGMRSGSGGSRKLFKWCGGWGCV